MRRHALAVLLLSVSANAQDVGVVPAPPPHCVEWVRCLDAESPDPPDPNDPALIEPRNLRRIQSGKPGVCCYDVVETPPLKVALEFPEPQKEREPTEVSVVLGAVTALSTADNNPERSVKPIGRILVDWPLAGWKRPMGVFVLAEITSLPDSEFTLANVGSFNSFEMSGAVWYDPIPSFAGSFYCEGGFASVFSTNAVSPTTTAPLWSGCGVYFEDKSTKLGRLKVGVGPDERLGYGWTMAIHVVGQLRVLDYSNMGLTLLLNSILGLESNPTGQRVNVIRIAAGISWDGKKENKP